ncbi:DNA-directed DNA polymerase [Tanacetum coccineum]
MYDEVKFRKAFRIARPLFNEIVTAVIDHDLFFRNNIDCTGKECIFGLLNERSSRLALDHFCQSVMRIYGPEYLRKPTVTDIEKLYLHHEEKHGSNNDINGLYQSPLFNDLKTGRAPEILFVANGVTYPSGYYLVDRIYPELASLVKTIQEPADDDHKRILYKQKQESARKDVERAFGVLKKKWAILANLTRVLKKEDY